VREEGHIGPLEGVMMVHAILAAPLFVQFPTYVLSAGGTAAWQIAVIITILAVLLLLPMAALIRRFPGQGLASITEAVAGPVVGIPLSLAVIAWLMASLVASLRILTEAFIALILPNTPPGILIAVAIGCAVYASYRGVEPLGRATQILFPLIFVGGWSVFFFSLPRAHVSYLFPFWGYGFQTTFFSSFPLVGLGAELVAFLILGHCFRTSRQFWYSTFWGTVLSGIALMATVLILVMVFGAPNAAQQPFPFFSLARMVYFGRFFQRTEAVIVMLWFFSAAVRISVLLHGAVITFGQAFRLPYHRPLVFPFATLVAALVALPEDTVAVIRFEQNWIRPIGALLMLLPGLLLLLSILTGKRGESHAA
jgi:spore germination protein KB